MDAVSSYFEAERAESLLFIGIGLLALGASAYFFIARRAVFYRGMALPLIAVAVIQVVVGATVALRSPQDAARVQAALQSRPALIAADELPRMQAVLESFVLYRWIEVALLLAGALLMATAGRSQRLRGAGMGLALQAALMLVLDLFAERRADAYLGFLTSL